MRQAFDTPPCTVPQMHAEGVRVSYDPSVDAAYVYLGGGKAATW